MITTIIASINVSFIKRIHLKNASHKHSIKKKYTKSIQKYTKLLPQMNIS
jgi:hypothetical protein